MAANKLLDERLNQQWQKLTQHQVIFTEQLVIEDQQRLQQAIMLSDFVFDVCWRQPEAVIDLFNSGELYQTSTPDYLANIRQQLEGCQTEAELNKLLRQYRMKAMTHIAIADMVLNIPLKESLRRLSLLAEALILNALEWLDSFCQQSWGRPVNSEGQQQPLLVLAMGKLGGQELNFSSDIDLIFTYPESGSTQGGRRELDNQEYFTRLGQKLINSLNQPTADGFVYRVDMRLRPFGDSGPLVLSFAAMEDYYQEQGRDWERYAMLKARLLGDSRYHQQLEGLLRPFVYRRYIDFSVIDSLRRMKMLIAQEVRRKHLDNNIKLGAGGIREIEFIVQAFQLIRGGRVKQLQQRHLLSVLPVLSESGELSQENTKKLAQAYAFLRRVENIIQAFADQQTQVLPTEPLMQQRLIYILSFASWSEFMIALEQEMLVVHDIFAQIVGLEVPHHQPKSERWLLLWEQQCSEQDAIDWLQDNADFWPAINIWRALADFKQEQGKRSIGNRGRQILDKLMPMLLWHLHHIRAAEKTLLSLLMIIDKITTRTAYLELLFENEAALAHLVKLCQESHWVAEHLAKYPILLDELIDPELLHNPCAPNEYYAELRRIMLRVPEGDQEAQMEALRQFKQAQHLRIAATDIVGVLSVIKVSDHLTILAEAILTEVVQLAWQQISARYGIPRSLEGLDDKGFAVIGYGKMGGIELGYGSDLDLVFVHNRLLNELTTGDKQVTASQFYIKLAQRIMHLFNTRMASGILYELDMRLRPSGNSGLLMVHIDTFEQYQLEEAWTWEHQALVRARAIHGDVELCQQFAEIRKKVLSSKRNHQELLTDVLAMRNKMRTNLDQSNQTLLDIKQGAGGLVDIEFLAQYLVLKYSKAYPDVSQFSDNISVFEQLYKVSLLTHEQYKVLRESYSLLRGLAHQQTLQQQDKLVNKEKVAAVVEQISTICQQLMVE